MQEAGGEKEKTKTNKRKSNKKTKKKRRSEKSKTSSHTHKHGKAGGLPWCETQRRHLKYRIVLLVTPAHRDGCIGHHRRVGGAATAVLRERERGAGSWDGDARAKL